MPIDPTLLATLKTKSPDQQNVIKYMVLPHTGCGKKSEWSDVDFDLHVNTALKTQSGEQMAIDALGIDIDDSIAHIRPIRQRVDWLALRQRHGGQQPQHHDEAEQDAQ